MLNSVLTYIANMSPWFAGLVVLEAFWLLAEGLSKISVERFVKLTETLDEVSDITPNWDILRSEIKSIVEEFELVGTLSSSKMIRVNEIVGEINTHTLAIAKHDAVWKKHLAMQERQFWLRVFHPKGYRKIIETIKSVDQKLETFLSNERHLAESLGELMKIAERHQAKIEQ